MVRPLRHALRSRSVTHLHSSFTPVGDSMTQATTDHAQNPLDHSKRQRKAVHQDRSDPQTAAAGSHCGWSHVYFLIDGDVD